jgi:hypothetical protein
MARTVRTNGARIVRLRQKLGLTQDELGAYEPPADGGRRPRTRMAERTVGRAERGGPVDISVVRRLAVKFGVECGELLANGISDGPPAPPDPWADGWQDRLAGLWTGRVDQPDGPDGHPFRGKFSLEFFRAGAEIRARYSFSFDGTEYEGTGPVTRLFERYFRLDAGPATPGRCLFNTIYFQVTPAGDRLTGRYVGLGPHSNKIVTGEATAVRGRR